MSKDKISEYSATAGSNTDVAGVSIAEGTAPSNINNAIRALMAHLKDMDAGTQALTSPALTSATITNATLGGLTYPTSDGSANQYLQTNGSGALSWSTVATTTNLASAVTGTLPVANGGTGATTLTDDSLLTGTGASAITAEANLTFNSSNVLSVDGTITCTGNITALTSDKRLKDFKGKIPSALEKVQKLNGYNFNWNDTAKQLNADVFDDENQVGVSAQEVLEVCPEAVKPAPVNNDYYTVQYEKLVPLLIEAVKDLKAEINEMKEGCKCNDSSN